MKSTNAMKMQMNPPSASTRQVTGPLTAGGRCRGKSVMLKYILECPARKQVLDNAMATHAQSIEALFRGDLSMAIDLHARCVSLMGSLE
jgi:hypothetical protein